jgi:hypothetical protein
MRAVFLKKKRRLRPDYEGRNEGDHMSDPRSQKMIFYTDLVILTFSRQ